jgi:Integrase core domain/Chromo (CHRromatin Organisation MOdifier) domain
VCQQYKGSTVENKGKLQPILANRPFDIVGMDILTDLPTTVRGNKHILVFTDYFTKWPEAYALPDLEAVTTARKFLEGIILRHGAPSRIITDRGSQFTADVFREVTELLGTKHSMTTAYHPQTDGQAERMVGTISTMLGKLTGLYQEDWDLYIPYALYAYRTAVHATTGETPFFLVYGRDEVSPSDMRLRQWIEGKKTTTDYTKLVIQRLQAARERVIKNSVKQKETNQKYYDRGREPSTFELGDVVWLKLGQNKPGEARKLKPKWVGPYRIIHMVENSKGLVVDIQHTANPLEKERVNVNRLKMAFLRPGERIADAIQPEEVTPEKVEIEQIVTEKTVSNPTGKTIWTRERRHNNNKRKRPTTPEQKEYEVEAILDEKGPEDGYEDRRFFVKWVGYSARHNSWVKEEDLHSDHLLEKWRASRKNKKIVKR